MPLFEVTGPARVAGARKGETAELDPAVVNIPALIEGGHVKPVSEPKAPKAGQK